MISASVGKWQLWQMCYSGQNSGFGRLQTIDVFRVSDDKHTVSDPSA
jgi:hypothetical protein